jgi:hypothetical protein
MISFLDLLLAFAILLDTVCLVSVRFVMRLLQEWLSIRQASAEVTLLILYGAAFGSLIGCTHGPHFPMYMLVVLVPLNVVHMIRRVRIPDVRRLELLSVPAEYAVSLFTSSVYAFIAFTWCTLTPHINGRFLIGGAFMTYVVFGLLVRLPRDESGSGKRRKAALKNIHELFGRPLTWLEPEPQGA